MFVRSVGVSSWCRVICGWFRLFFFVLKFSLSVFPRVLCLAKSRTSRNVLCCHVFFYPLFSSHTPLQRNRSPWFPDKGGYGRRVDPCSTPFFKMPFEALGVQNEKEVKRNTTSLVGSFSKFMRQLGPFSAPCSRAFDFMPRRAHEKVIRYWLRNSIRPSSPLLLRLAHSSDKQTSSRTGQKQMGMFSKANI